MHCTRISEEQNHFFGCHCQPIPPPPPTLSNIVKAFTCHIERRKVIHRKPYLKVLKNEVKTVEKMIIFSQCMHPGPYMCISIRSKLTKPLLWLCLIHCRQSSLYEILEQNCIHEDQHMICLFWIFSSTTQLDLILPLGWISSFHLARSHPSTQLGLILLLG